MSDVAGLPQALHPRGVMRSNVSFVGIGILVTACAASDRTQHRDFGSGVDVVHNAAPRTQHQLQVHSSLLIGEADGDTVLTFGRISDMAVSSDGRIYVADSYAQRIAAFSPTGQYIRAFGRSGRGPGEFQNLSRLWSSGDTVLAEDITAQRFSAFDSTGTVLTTAPMTDYHGALTFLVARSASGWLGEIRSLAAGDGRANVWQFPLTESSVIDPYTGGTVRSLYSVSHPDTSRAPALFGGAYRGGTIGYQHLYLVVQGEPYEVHVFDLEGGSLRRVVLQDYKPRKVDPAWLRVAETRISDYYVKRPTPPGWSGGRDAQLQRLRDANVRDIAAPVGRMLADSAGFLWVHRLDLSTDMSDQVLDYLALRDEPRGQSTWEIFDPRGILVGQVTLPTAFRATVVRAMSVYGVLKDELGVERVAKYVVRTPA